LVLAGPALAEDWNAASCTEDAMLVLDASGSMVQGQGASPFWKARAAPPAKWCRPPRSTGAWGS
jgi:hypothetical protein